MTNAKMMLSLEFTEADAFLDEREHTLGPVVRMSIRPA